MAPAGETRALSIKYMGRRRGRPEHGRPYDDPIEFRPEGGVGVAEPFNIKKGYLLSLVSCQDRPRLSELEARDFAILISQKMQCDYLNLLKGEITAKQRLQVERRRTGERGGQDISLERKGNRLAGKIIAADEPLQIYSVIKARFGLLGEDDVFDGRLKGRRNGIYEPSGIGQERELHFCER